GPETLVVDVDGAVDDDVVRGLPETRHRRVVADLEVERVCRRSVNTRLEQQRVALGAELVGNLLSRDGIDGLLDLADRHARVEDVDIGAEIGFGRRRGRSRQGGDREGVRGYATS